VDNELLHTLSYSDGSSPVPMNQSNALTPSPSSPQTPSKIPSTEPALSISDETCNEPTADHAIPDATAVPITPTATNTLENKNESHLAVNTEKNDKPKNISSTIPVNIQIRIKFDFQIQLSRKNIQELSILKQSDKTTVQLLTVFLQTPRERDVLCTLLTALINKKKEMKQERKQTKDVVRAEIHPASAGEKTNANDSLGIAAEEKKKMQDKERKLKAAREQINQLKMETTQLLEEKRAWKTEKDKLQDVGKMKTEQINKLNKEKKRIDGAIAKNYQRKRHPQRIIGRWKKRKCTC